MLRTNAAKTNSKSKNHRILGTDEIRGTLSLFQRTRVNFHVVVFIITVFRLQK